MIRGRSDGVGHIYMTVLLSVACPGHREDAVSKPLPVASPSAVGTIVYPPLLLGVRGDEVFLVGPRQKPPWSRSSDERTDHFDTTIVKLHTTDFREHSEIVVSLPGLQNAERESDFSYRDTADGLVLASVVRSDEDRETPLPSFPGSRDNLLLIRDASVEFVVHRCDLDWSYDKPGCDISYDYRTAISASRDVAVLRITQDGPDDRGERRRPYVEVYREPGREWTLAGFVPRPDTFEGAAFQLVGEWVGDRLVTVWWQFRGRDYSDPGGLHILTSTWDAREQTWTRVENMSPLPLWESAGSQEHGGCMESLSRIDANARGVHVAWAKSLGEDAGVIEVASVDDGRIERLGAPLGVHCAAKALVSPDRIDLSSLGSGAPLVTWIDGRTGGYEVYVASWEGETWDVRRVSNAGIGRYVMTPRVVGVGESVCSAWLEGDHVDDLHAMVWCGPWSSASGS